MFSVPHSIRHRPEACSGHWRWLILAAVVALASAADPVVPLMVGSAAATAGSELNPIEGGWSLLARHGITQHTEIPLGRFPARREQAYAIGCQLSGPGVAVTLKVRWLDAQGKDAGDWDRQLGYGDPTLVATTPAGWTGAAVPLRLSGKAARSALTQGELVLAITKLGKGEAITITRLVIAEDRTPAQAAPPAESIRLSVRRHARGGLCFPEEAPKPELRIALEGLLPTRQAVVVRGRIQDQDGKPVGTIEQPVALEPGVVRELDLALEAPPRFGSYAVELEVMVDGRAVATGLAGFAWLRRPSQPDEVRRHQMYPFGMNPALPVVYSADGNPRTDLAEVEFQADLLQRLGVGAIRLMDFSWGLHYADREGSLAAVRKRIQTWRATVWPILQRHGVDVWVSLMEQGMLGPNEPFMPKTAEQLAVWRDYNFERVKAYGGIPHFYLFGNEGLGGHTPESFDAEVQMYDRPPTTTTVRQWMSAYRVARASAKAADPDCLFGPSHASDMDGRMARAFGRFFGKEGAADLWGFNCYTNPAEMARSIQGVLRSGGYAPGFGVVPEYASNAAYAGPTRAAEERKQAIVTVQSYLSTLAQGWVRHLNLYILHYGRHDTNAVFDGDEWRPRPLAAAYSVMADTLRAGQVERRIAIPGGGEFFVWRRIDRSVVGIGWAPGEKPLTLEVGGAAEVEVRDLYGNGERHRATKGILTLALGESPIYVLGATDLVESKALEIAIANATAKADGPDVVAIKVCNNTDAPQTVTLSSRSQPQVAVTPAEARVEVGAGRSVSSEFRVAWSGRDDRVRSQVGFGISNHDYLAYETRLVDAFARCVRAPAPPAFDGTWTGWERAQALHADQAGQVVTLFDVPWAGPDDLSAVIRTLWDAQNFYLGVETTDDVFRNAQKPGMVFLEDSIELGFDLDHSLSNSATLWQFLAGRSTEGDIVQRALPGPGARLATHRLAIHPTGTAGGMVYQLAIPWSELGAFQPTPGRQIGFGVIVDDGDGKGRAGRPDRRFTSWFGSGISSKRPSELGDLIFVQ